MKEYKNIEELLERYYDAQTSEAEEKELKDFFSNEDLPVHLQKEKEMFLQLQVIQESNGSRERLDKQIDQWAMQERFTAKVSLKRRFLQMGSIAASLLILLCMGWYIYVPQARQDTCRTPEEAYVHTEKALMMFAQALNKGVKQMEVIQKSTQKVERNIQKQLNKLND